jgi:hypothetical protein
VAELQLSEEREKDVRELFRNAAEHCASSVPPWCGRFTQQDTWREPVAAYRLTRRHCACHGQGAKLPNDDFQAVNDGHSVEATATRVAGCEGSSIKMAAMIAM